MKPSLRPVIFLALAAAVAFAIYSVFFPPTEKVIAKRLKNLATAISANPAGNIARVANVSRIGSFFHPNVRISVEGFGRDISSIGGRGELEQMALALRQNVGSIEVRFYNVAVQVAGSKTEATAKTTALVHLNDRSDPVVQPVAIEFEKVGRAWLIRSVTPVAGEK